MAVEDDEAPGAQNAAGHSVTCHVAFTVANGLRIKQYSMWNLGTYTFTTHFITIIITIDSNLKYILQ